MTRSPLSSFVSVNLILGRVDGACWANAAAANANIASSVMKAPDGNTYSTRWRGNPVEMVGRTPCGPRPWETKASGGSGGSGGSRRTRTEGDRHSNGRVNVIAAVPRLRVRRPREG